MKKKKLINISEKTFIQVVLLLLGRLHHDDERIGRMGIGFQQDIRVKQHVTVFPDRLQLKSARWNRDGEDAVAVAFRRIAALGLDCRIRDSFAGDDFAVRAQPALRLDITRLGLRH